MNLSTVTDNETARTDYQCALQRAYNLAVFGVKTVTELCVGPSLRTLEAAYGEYGITVIGNDIDPRWKEYYRDGWWLIGDCFTVPWDTDAVVFAPPLSKGCTGKREDALQIDQVFPKYVDFLARKCDAIRVMVLPARSLATRQDRTQLCRLLSKIDQSVTVPLTAGRRQTRKYVDVYF